MFKNILTISIPLCIYLILFNFIDNQKDIILVTLIASSIIFWASSLIPDYQTSLLFLFFTLVFSLDSKQIIFSGFSSSAFWLVFAGMLISTAIKNVNLTNKVSNLFIKFENPSYLKILLTLAIFSSCFSFIMPSGVGRVVLLVPLGIIIAKNFGFEEGSKGYIGILFTIILSSSMIGFTILPANAPNMILAGLISQIYNYELLYSHYLLVNLLIFGIIKNIILISLVYFFFKDTPKIQNLSTSNTQTSKNEKIVLIVLFIMLIFWFSDFIHGISPAIVGMFGALFLMHPSINIIKIKDFNTLNLSSLIFLAGLISLGNVAANSEFTKDILSWSLGILNFSSSEFLNYMQISTFMSFCAVFLTQPTIPTLFTPIAHEMSLLSGFPLQEIFMLEVAGFSTVFFPFQMPPLIIGLSLAKIKPLKMIKILVITAFISIFVLYPLQYFWIKILKDLAVF